MSHRPHCARFPTALPFLLVSLLGAMVLASPAAAAPLRFVATLSVELPGPPLIPADLASGSGTADVAPDGGFTIPAGVLRVDGATTVGQGLTVQADGSNGAGVFAPGGGGFGGALPLDGRLHYQFATLLTTSIPLLPIGVGGSVSADPIPLPIVLSGGPWKTGFTGFTPPSGTPFLSGTGVDGRTPLGVGTLSMVSPIAIVVTGTTGLDQFGVARLTLVFRAPEPTAALLVATGLLALVAAGRLRSRPKS
ncbi:MAG: hypothetical protein QNK05_23740 [Myxococcota bacterium]|nr:hypothetical protein [Myxococcota bacterium]